MTKAFFAVTVAVLLGCSFAIGQRFLVRFSSGNPEIPDGWPVETSNPLDDSDVSVPKGWSTNWTKDQLNQRIAILKPGYDSIQDAAISARRNTESDRRALLADLFKDFQAYERGWMDGTNYNAATLQAIIRRHNGVLLLLKPILNDLYESRR